MWSQPSWAAWIEILVALFISSIGARRSPLGLRGLKSQYSNGEFTCSVSQPSWAAWIEMLTITFSVATQGMSQPSWAAWIEIEMEGCDNIALASRSPLGLRGLKYKGGA